MKTVLALKKFGVIASMWWIVAISQHMISGPQGAPVGMWIGPWDSKAICERMLKDFNRSLQPGDTDGFDTPYCGVK